MKVIIDGKYIVATREQLKTAIEIRGNVELCPTASAYVLAYASGITYCIAPSGAIAWERLSTEID